MNAGSALVEASAPMDAEAVSDGDKDRGLEHELTRAQRSDSKTRLQEKASRDETRIEPDDCQAKNLERGVA